MTRTKQRGFIGAACFLLAALLLVLTLSAQIRLRAVEREIRALEEQRDELKRESAILRVRFEKERSLAEIERRAEEELGMRRCRGDQIIELVIEDESAEYK